MRLLRVFVLACASLSFIIPAFGQGASDALMRLLKSGNLPSSRYPVVIEMVAKRGDAADLDFLFDKVTRQDGWIGEVAAAALNGLVEAAENRKLKPTGDLSRLKVLLSPERNAPGMIRRPAVRLAGLWQVPELVKPLKELATADDTPALLRTEALEALARYGDVGRKTIEALAAEKQPLAVRSHAIAALASLDLNAAAKQAADALASSDDLTDPAPLLAAFLNRRGGPDALARALEGASIPPELAKSALRAMYSVGRSDGALSAALGKAAGIAMEDKPLTPQEVQQLTAAVKSEGDAARGELVFRRRDVACLNCHSVSGAGGNIGPDLSAIGPSNPVEFLVTSVLDPDAAVKEHYATQVVITSDGLVVTGIVADENDARIVLRTAEGIDRSIPKADIEVREKGGSLMPKGLVKFMTRQEFVDLVRFLSELGKPGTPYALRSKPTIQRWRSLVDPPESFSSGLPDEATFGKELPAVGTKSWQALYAHVDGTLPISEIAGGTAQPRYLLAELEVRAGGAVGLRFNDVTGLDLWVNGDHIDTLSKSFISEFAAGRQTIVLRVDPAQRKSPIRVELFQPEGSAAVAEPVGGT